MTLSKSRDSPESIGVPKAHKYTLNLDNKQKETKKQKLFLYQFIYNLSLESSQTTVSKVPWNSGKPEKEKVL
jgi:hypothetical protein